jgi:peptidoglycan hydrolase CwlO-like protein
MKSKSLILIILIGVALITLSFATISKTTASDSNVANNSSTINVVSEPIGGLISEDEF